MQYQVDSYAGKVRTLSIFWFIYAGLSLLMVIAGMAFAHAFLAGAPWMHGPWTHGPWSHGPWSHGPLPPDFFGPVFMHLIWVTVLIRAALAFAAGWGLMERTPWGRVVAIVAAVLSLLRFPFGTALGIWTLVMLLGYRNATLYDQL
jgi:hypothetical protein